MLAHLTTPHTDREDAKGSDGVSKLGEVLAKLGRAITSAQVSRVLVEGGLVAAEATNGALVLLSDDRSELHVAHVVGEFTDGVAQEGRLSLHARFPLADVVRSRRELWLSNPFELAERYPDLVPLDDHNAWVALPLMIDSVILGAVGWSFPRQWFTAEQRACLRSLAHEGGVALYRAGVFDSERHERMLAEDAHSEGTRRDVLMASVSTTLDGRADSVNAISSMAKIVRLVVPALGQWCAINVVDDDGRLRQVAATHIDAARERLLRELGRLNGNSGEKIPSGLHAGRAVSFESIGETTTRATGLHRRDLRSLRVAGLQHLLVAPLRAHGRTFGTLCCASDDATSMYSDADLALAEDVARRCAASLEYARLQTAVKQAAHAHEDFVAATSHELRTPLSHIKGFVSTLRTSDTDWDADTRDDFLGEIEHEADRLARLVETLIDMSRIDSGGLDPTGWAFTPPAALVQAGIDRVRASLGERQLDVQVSDDLPPVWVDASQVERVIANLIDNAAKYSPASEPIGVIGKLAEKSIMFRIEDRGLGIPTGHLERIFEPFFREPTGDYPAKPGTGLGLAICRSIIRSQNGRVWAEHRPGGGTAFVFTLPTKARKPAT